MGRIHECHDKERGKEMIRRSWVIYERKTRQVISQVYHRRILALSDLGELNNYCGKKKYAMQLRRFDTDKKCVVSHYPKIELKELPKQRREVVKNE
jgi:hypothetical protein